MLQEVVFSKLKVGVTYVAKGPVGLRSDIASKRGFFFASLSEYDRKLKKVSCNVMPEGFGKKLIESQGGILEVENLGGLKSI